MNKLYRVKDGDQFRFVLANGSSDREEKIQNGIFKSEIDLRDAKVGHKVCFTSGYAVVNRDGFDLDGFEGRVVKKDADEIHVKLDEHYEILNEWNNCLIFDADSYFDDDENPIKVVEIRKDEENK